MAPVCSAATTLQTFSWQSQVSNCQTRAERQMSGAFLDFLCMSTLPLLTNILHASGDSLYIWDPHGHHLSASGKKDSATSAAKQYQHVGGQSDLVSRFHDQFAAWDFGGPAVDVSSRVECTLFRLPLRSISQAQRSSMCTVGKQPPAHTQPEIVALLFMQFAWLVACDARGAGAVVATHDVECRVPRTLGMRSRLFS